MIPIFGPSDIRPHLNIADLIPTAERALRSISDGTAQAPVYVLHPNDMADIHVKSAALPGCPIFTVKMAGWSQVLADRGEPASSGMIAVFDSETCKPLAILQDDHLISDYRTAAAGAVVANLLAPEDAHDALVVGTGTQAILQAEALLVVRPIQNIAVWGRDMEKARTVCKVLKQKNNGLGVSVVDDLSKAVAKADVIITATGAKEPIIKEEWVRAGQHFTSVGSDDTTKCELEPAILSSADVFVDAKNSGERYGSPSRAISQGLITSDALTEIGAALESKYVRESTATTIACLCGLGIQDLTAVAHFWNKINSVI
jgi:ornithine cyclodeaminase/alanine dehydrogenase-like protein (mu-crystallin family)